MITLQKSRLSAKILGFVCGIVLLVSAVFFVINVDQFSQDLLIPCLTEKEGSFECPQVGAIVSKPLRYLGHGAESIAFVSEDNQYVLKFFLKYDIFKKKCPRWRKSIQRLSGFRFAKRSREQILRRYAQGSSFLADVTGVLAVHRYKSIEQLPTCSLIDHRGIRHTLDLNDFAFVIQKKGHLISKEEWASDRTHLDAKFQELFARIANAGFVSLSETFNRDNFAILDDQAIMIDLGKLEYLPEQSYAAEEERLHQRYINVMGPTPH